MKIPRPATNRLLTPLGLLGGEAKANASGSQNVFLGLLLLGLCLFVSSCAELEEEQGIASRQQALSSQGQSHCEGVGYDQYYGETAGGFCCKGACPVGAEWTDYDAICAIDAERAQGNPWCGTGSNSDGQDHCERAGYDLYYGESAGGFCCKGTCPESAPWTDFEAICAVDAERAQGNPWCGTGAQNEDPFIVTAIESFVAGQGQDCDLRSQAETFGFQSMTVGLGVEAAAGMGFGAEVSLAHSLIEGSNTMYVYRGLADSVSVVADPGADLYLPIGFWVDAPENLSGVSLSIEISAADVFGAKASVFFEAGTLRFLGFVVAPLVGAQVGGNVTFGVGSTTPLGTFDVPLLDSCGRIDLELINGVVTPVVEEASCRLEMIADASVCGYEQVTSAAACGYEQVTSAAVCGYEQVTSAATCGFEMIADASVCGYEQVTSAAVCGYEQVTSAAVCGYEQVTSAAVCGFDQVTSLALCGGSFVQDAAGCADALWACGLQCAPGNESCYEANCPAVASSCYTPSTCNSSTPSTCSSGTPATCNSGTPATCNSGTPATCSSSTAATCNSGTPATCDSGTPATCNSGTPTTCNVEVCD